MYKKKILLLLAILVFAASGVLYYKNSAKPENSKPAASPDIAAGAGTDNKIDAEIEFKNAPVDKNNPEAVKAYYESKKTFNPSTISDDLKCKDCNVIIISATNVRKDRLSLYGYNRETSPKIDKFAENSLVFENAFAPASWTLPNNISLYTSLFPYEHGVMNRFGETKLNPAITSLIDILKDSGYKTAAFTGGFDYGEKWGLINRFDEKNIYKNETGAVSDQPQEVGEYGRLSSATSRSADWMKQNKDEKFLLLVQGYDAHCPFNPKAPYDKIYTDPEYMRKDLKNNFCYVTLEPVRPVIKNGTPYYHVNTLFFNPGDKSPVSVPGSSTDPNSLPKIMPPDLTSLEFDLGPEDVRNLNDLYDGEIGEVDDAIGQIFESLEELDLYKKTIVIFMSDHGDLIGEHDRFMRGGAIRGTFYNEVINFPLVIKNPKFGDKRIDGMVRMTDIMPTVLDFLGISAKYQSQGRSLVPLITNGEEVNKFVFAGSAYNPGVNNYFFSKKSRTSAIMDNDWKLIKEEIGDGNGGMPNDGNDKFIAEEVSYELYDIKNDPRELKNLYGERKDIFENLELELSNWESQF